MATTTATVSINSSDLIPGQPLSINASHTLTKSGLTEASAQDALAEAIGTTDSSNWLYLCNKSTNDLHYIIVALHDTRLGNLGAGEWMWMPY